MFPGTLNFLFSISLETKGRQPLKVYFFNSKMSIHSKTIQSTSLKLSGLLLLRITDIFRSSTKKVYRQNGGHLGFQFLRQFSDSTSLTIFSSQTKSSTNIKSRSIERPHSPIYSNVFGLSKYCLVPVLFQLKVDLFSKSPFPLPTFQKFIALLRHFRSLNQLHILKAHPIAYNFSTRTCVL